MNRALHFAVDNYGFARAAQPGGSQGAASYQLELSAHPIDRPAHASWSPVPLSRMGTPYAASGRDAEAPVKIMPVSNAIESVNARPRKIIKTRGHFPGHRGIKGSGLNPMD